MDPYLFLLILTASLVLFLAVAVIIFAYIAYRMTFMRVQDDYDPYNKIDRAEYEEHRELILYLIDRISSKPYTELYITADDGTRLGARYYLVDRAAPVHIMCHGYKSTPLRDCCGSSADAIEAGQNVLLVSQRAHGLSGGKTIGFGILECLDLLLWIDKIIELHGPDVKILLEGTSMGGATVLMAAGLDLPKNVCGIIADCPYNEPREIISEVIRKMRLPAALIYPFVRLGAVIFGKFDPDSLCAGESVAKSGLPILIMHGESDDFVPMMMSKRVADVREGISYVSYPGAGHCMSYILHREKYMSLRDKFKEDCLRKAI